MIEPNEGERRNGWTAETLTAYVRERERAHSEEILNRPEPLPARANGRYSPHKWRG